VVVTAGSGALQSFGDDEVDGVEGQGEEGKAGHWVEEEGDGKGELWRRRG
jgi:hypothetical protein